MSGGLHAEPGRMTQDGNNTIDNADEFRAEIDGLSSSISELLSIWRGASADAFYKSYAEKAAELLAFRNLLEERGENVVQGANLLDKNEQDLTAMGSSLFK